MTGVLLKEKERKTETEREGEGDKGNLCTEKRPCEDTRRRQTSASQREK